MIYIYDIIYYSYINISLFYELNLYSHLFSFYIL